MIRPLFEKGDNLTAKVANKPFFFKFFRGEKIQNSSNIPEFASKFCIK